MSVMPGTPTNRTSRAGGFTLVELLAVMLILGILMTLVIGVTWLIFRDTKIVETKTNMKIIMTAIMEYRKANGSFPTGQSTLVSDLKSVAESKSQIAKLGKETWDPADTTSFRDSWGNAIVYSPIGGLGGGPKLTSPGPDGDINTEEDNVRHNK
jgi:prepilin-type N-terminal cleavage/methylation domain-containing protein